MDGIDAALVRTDGHSVETVGDFISVAYEDTMREMIRCGLAEAASLSDKDSLSDPLKTLEAALTEAHAKAVHQLLDLNSLSPSQIDVIGFHGQTVTHKPHKGWTLQLGDGQALADKTAIDVVCDFRSNDMAHGGQGAPLAPLYHAALVKGLARDGEAVAILNLGGVANVTWVQWQGEVLNIVGFDTGPANALMDDWAQMHIGKAYDAGGKLAGSGLSHENILLSMLDHDYFDAPPPKSLDRDDFTINSARGLTGPDGASTLMDFTVETVNQAQRHFPSPVSAWYATGGGIYNDILMQRLGAKLSAPLHSVASLNWRADALEAEAFAYLAVRSMKGLPLSVPTTTGCKMPITGGVLHKASS